MILHRSIYKDNIDSRDEIVTLLARPRSADELCLYTRKTR